MYASIRRYKVSPGAAAEIAQRVNQGFVPMPTEWWHYDDPECRRYPILDLPFAQLR